jgi:hypothetical protein
MRIAFRSLDSRDPGTMSCQISMFQVILSIIDPSV